jgi:hypothetical protein
MDGLEIIYPANCHAPDCSTGVGLTFILSGGIGAGPVLSSARPFTRLRRLSTAPKHSELHSRITIP